VYVIAECNFQQSACQKTRPFSFLSAATHERIISHYSVALVWLIFLGISVGMTLDMAVQFTVF